MCLRNQNQILFTQLQLLLPTQLVRRDPERHRKVWADNDWVPRMKRGMTKEGDAPPLPSWDVYKIQSIIAKSKLITTEFRALSDHVSISVVPRLVRGIQSAVAKLKLAMTGSRAWSAGWRREGMFHLCHPGVSAESRGHSCEIYAGSDGIPRVKRWRFHFRRPAACPRDLLC